MNREADMTTYATPLAEHLGTVGVHTGTTVRQTVVVGVEDTPTAAAAVDHAACEAELRGWPLRIVAVQERPATPAGRDRATALLDRMSDRAYRRTRTVPVTSRLVVGTPVSCLLDQVTPEDLLVVGASQVRAAGLLAGATGDHLAARHRGTVLVVRTPGPPLGSWPARPVVAGYDGSPWAERAVRFALDEARWRGSELTVFWSLPPGTSRAEAWLRAARLRAEADRAGVTSRLRPLDGGARCRLILESENAAAVVVGSRGAGGLGGQLLGSVSQALIHGARCPVFVVH